MLPKSWYILILILYKINGKGMINPNNGKGMINPKYRVLVHSLINYLNKN